MWILVLTNKCCTLTPRKTTSGFFSSQVTQGPGLFPIANHGKTTGSPTGKAREKPWVFPAWESPKVNEAFVSTTMATGRSFGLISHIRSRLTTSRAFQE